MTQQTPLPSEQERQAFTQKLGQFRATLPPAEQRMLDAMVIAAFKPQDDQAVEGYEWFHGGTEWVPSTSSPNPWWYHGSGAAAWDYTPFQSAYSGTSNLP
jgi:hypothetical protein